MNQYDGNTVALTTGYTYDGVGNMLTMTAGGNTTTYTYDRFGNVLTMTDALGQVETNTYSALGVLASKTDRNNVTTYYSYDSMGRLLSTSAGTDSVYKLYTMTGQVAGEQSKTQQVSYTYDGLGRCVSASEIEPGANGISYNKTYTYDLADNRTGFTLTRGSTAVQSVTYAYDNLNRLSTVSESGTVRATYTYDTNGNRASLTYANGVTETYSYNKANWITGLTNSSGGSTVSDFDYTYYASGSQKTETDHTGKVTSYVYDGLNRLTQESETGGLTVNYTYDAAGNRSQMTVTGTESYTTAYTYDANNRLLTEVKTENGSASTTTYTYDGNGNTLTKSGAGGTVTNTYNNLNQLTGVTANGITASYTYNAQGIRTGKQVGSGRTYFLLDGGNVVAEMQNNAVTARYLRGVNLISRNNNYTTEYYLFNAHGDVVNLVNPAGAATRSYDYDAFGNESNPDGSDANPFRYCGEYWNAETGTYYLRARYYDPDIGRFTQQDTHWNSANSIYGDNPQTVNQRADALNLKAYTHIPQITAVMQSGNLYAYAVNNPSAYSDHNGEIALEAAMLFIAANPEVVALIATGVLAGLVYLGHQSVELLERAMNSQAWKQIEAAIQNAVSGSAAAAPGAPDPEDEPERKENPNKNESKVWKRFDNVKNSKLKTSGKGTNKKYYDWDHTHNDIEVYNAQGKHLGSMDPTTGEMYKPAVPGRSIKVP